MDAVEGVVIMTSLREYLEREYPDISIQEEWDEVSSMEMEIGKQRTLEWRAAYVELAVYQAALTHFGCSHISSEELKELFLRAVEMTLDYYYGDWWTPERAAEWLAQHPPRSELGRLVDAAGRPEMDPNFTGPQDLNPFHAAGSMLIALFSDKRDELARICDWFDLRLKPARMPGGVEEEYQLGILCMISRFRSQPIPGIDEAVKKVEKCRHKRPKAFLQLINAVFDRDVAAYHEALPRSLELHYHRRKIESILGLVNIEQSVLVEFARRNGMEPPPLEGRARHTLLTPQSLGFC